MYLATCLDSGETVDGIACDSDSTTADMCPLDYGGSGDGCQPPNLITTLIDIALSPGDCDEPMFSGQANLQVRAGRMLGAFLLRREDAVAPSRTPLSGT